MSTVRQRLAEYQVEQRHKSIKQLGCFVFHSAEECIDLIECGHFNSRVRQAAAFMLGRLPMAPEYDFCPVLQILCEDEDAGVRIETYQTCKRILRGSSFLLRAASHETSEDAQRIAVECLSAFLYEPEVVEQLAAIAFGYTPENFPTEDLEITVTPVDEDEPEITVTPVQEEEIQIHKVQYPEMLRMAALQSLIGRLGNYQEEILELVQDPDSSWELCREAELCFYIDRSFLAKLLLGVALVPFAGVPVRSLLYQRAKWFVIKLMERDIE
jgi:hypothetical protein